MKKTLSIIFILNIVFSCVVDLYETREIQVTNNLDYDIYCFNSMNDSLNEYFGDLNYVNMDEAYTIRGGKTDSLYNVPRNWNTYIEESNSGKMRIIVVPVDSVKKYGWNYIFEKNIYARKLLLDLEELNRLNWHITIN